MPDDTYQGTYAKVKYGQHVETGEAVAIKILDKERLVQVCFSPACGNGRGIGDGVMSCFRSSVACDEMRTRLQLLGPALLMTPQDEMVDQIKREITILKHINHPNVVDLKEVGT